MRTIILKQTHCPSCDAQKMFLHATTQNKYQDTIVEIVKEDNEEMFAKWVDIVGANQTPTTIFVNENMQPVQIIHGFKAGDLKAALEKHFPNI